MSNSQGIYLSMCFLPLSHTSALLQLCPWCRSGWSGGNKGDSLGIKVIFSVGIYGFSHVHTLLREGGRKSSGWGGSGKKKKTTGECF